MAFIIVVIMVLYFILITWTWHSLGSIENTKKVAYSIIGIIIMCFVTLIVFNISQKGILYDNIKMQNDVRNMLVFLFAGINGIIVMPQLAKLLDKINEEQIEKNQIIAHIAIILIIFIICLVFETGYMKDTQEGILKVYHKS